MSGLLGSIKLLLFVVVGLLVFMLIFKFSSAMKRSGKVARFLLLPFGILAIFIFTSGVIRVLLLGLFIFIVILSTVFKVVKKIAGTKSRGRDSTSSEDSGGMHGGDGDFNEWDGDRYRSRIFHRD